MTDESENRAVGEDRVMTEQQRWMAKNLELQLLVLRQLQTKAECASDAITGVVGWLAIERHVRARLRTLNRMSGGRAEALAQLVTTHRHALDRLLDQARGELEGVDHRLRQQARKKLGLRVAVLGKGGAGKTLVASTLARTLARKGRRVLAVDLDPNPGLTFGLGMLPSDAGLPPEALDRADDGSWLTLLAPGLHPMAVVEGFADRGPDGVRYLGIGKITDPDRTAFRRSMGPLFQILSNLADPDWDVIADLEAGGSTPFQGYHDFAERVLLVVEPSWKSALTARRLQGLLGAVPAMTVANKFRAEPDHPGLHPAHRIPFDPAVIQADRLGCAPIDHAADGPAVRAIGDLADRLTHEEVLV